MAHFTTEDSYLSFIRARVKMFGPETDELVRNGQIVTPQSDISTANFPLGNELFSDLLVLVPVEKNWNRTIEEVLNNLELAAPEPRHAIRFVSQFVTGYKPKDQHQAHAGRNVIFPHTPFIPGDIKIARMFAKDQAEILSSWLVSIWREESGRPELGLWSCYGRDWKVGSKDLIAGVAQRLRQIEPAEETTPLVLAS
jgi:hypothetical protein